MEINKLSAPFPINAISWRVGATTKDKTKGIGLAYLNARDVMQRLDDVCGVQNWQCRYTHAHNKTICEIGIKIDNEWIWKANGAGDTQVEAEKGAISDAFKRSAVLWGVGRYLYDMPNKWVELDDRRGFTKQSITTLNNEHAKLIKSITGKKPEPKSIEDISIRADNTLEYLDQEVRNINKCKFFEEVESYKKEHYPTTWKQFSEEQVKELLLETVLKIIDLSTINKMNEYFEANQSKWRPLFTDKQFSKIKTLMENKRKNDNNS